MKRIFHHWEKWECVKAGMYETGAGLDRDQSELAYCRFLRNSRRFGVALKRVLSEWPVSCEQFLTNDSINRIAWLGQAAMCMDSGVPRTFRAGFKRLKPEQQMIANRIADEAFIRWDIQRRQLRLFS